MKLRRVAIGLVASAAAAMAAVPAPAVAASHAPNGVRHATGMSARLCQAARSHPAPAHRHRDVVKRSPATVNTNSKRDGGHAAMPVLPVRVVPNVYTAASGSAPTALPARVPTALAARAPPARQ